MWPELVKNISRYFSDIKISLNYQILTTLLILKDEIIQTQLRLQYEKISFTLILLSKFQTEVKIPK